VKLGQWAGTRPDLFGGEVAKEMGNVRFGIGNVMDR